MINSFRYKKKSRDFFLTKFQPHIEDDFVIGHVMAHELPIHVRVESVKDDNGKHIGVGRNLRYGKKKQGAVELVLTSRKLLIAFHNTGSWGASTNVSVKEIQSIQLTDDESKFPRLVDVRTERGPLLGNACRMMLFIADGDKSRIHPTKVLGFMIEDNWLPGLLRDLRY